MRRLASAIVLVAALAGCGGSGSSGVSPSAYVHSVCTTIYPYERDVVVSGAKLQAALFAVKTPVEAKRVLQAYITTVSADTDTAVTKLRAAGSPNVKNGARIASTILDAFTAVGSAMHQALSEVASLPTGNLTAFRTGIQRLELRLSSLRNIGQKLQPGGLNSPELHKAGTRDPACRGASSG